MSLFSVSSPRNTDPKAKLYGYHIFEILEERIVELIEYSLI